MEIFYKAYTKMAQNNLHYFVKRYLSFPEYKEVNDVLEGYGMHTDFDKACDIAGVTDPKIKKQLFDEIQASLPQAKIIDLNPSEEIKLQKKIAP